MQLTEGTVRVNLLRKDQTFDTHQMTNTIPDRTDMTDIVLHEINALVLQERVNIFTEVDVEVFKQGKWQSPRIILTFDHLLISDADLYCDCESKNGCDVCNPKPKGVGHA